MTAIVQYFADGYNRVLYDFADTRTQDYFLVASPFPVIALLFSYYNFVTKWGPEMMKDRKPFNIDRLLQAYNLIQVALCSYIFINIFLECYGPFGKYNLYCQPIDLSDDEFNRRIIKYVWIYYMLKVFDLVDTVFFVLRKKGGQISTLHLYHHTGMILVGWIGTKYVPGGQGVFLCLINSFVHAVMYSYYFLTNYDPEYRKKLWWKKHVTQLQMFQFFCLILFLGQVLFRADCTYPTWPIALFLPHNFVILYMFAKFYQRTYLTKKKKT